MRHKDRPHDEAPASDADAPSPYRKPSKSQLKRDMTALQELGRIETARFTNPVGLESLGNNLLAETPASGAPQVGTAGLDGRGSIRQGSLEASNVNVVEELVDMIETQRAYEVNSKMIQATDEMMRNAAQTL